MTARELYLAHGTDYSTLTQHINKNRERRAQLRAQVLAEAADIEGVYVCAADSLTAGNCREGTRGWIDTKNLDTRKHYKATEILRLVDSQRVALVIASAVRRHRAEIKNGFADLQQHRFE
jgi:hypothetical protein